MPLATGSRRDTGPHYSCCGAAPPRNLGGVGLVAKTGRGAHVGGTLITQLWRGVHLTASKPAELRPPYEPFDSARNPRLAERYSHKATALFWDRSLAA